MVYQKQISIDTSSMRPSAVEQNSMPGKEGLRHASVNSRQFRQ
jgi:hypothetical protein